MLSPASLVELCFSFRMLMIGSDGDDRNRLRTAW